MPTSPHLNAAAPSAGRVRFARVADGIVASYVHELARLQRDVADAAPRAVRPRTGEGRVRGARRQPGRDRRPHWERRVLHPQPVA